MLGEGGTDRMPAKRSGLSTARQAEKGGETEGYSIPAQREACSRKAGDLGASVVEEFVDAGASARSADRPALQAMLERLKLGGIDYVIVHKVDRLARDRADDVMIALAIHKAGAKADLGNRSRRRHAGRHPTARHHGGDLRVLFQQPEPGSEERPTRKRPGVAVRLRMPRSVT